MIEKEEKLTLEEQRINETLSENFDRSKWKGLTPNYAPPGFEDDCITLEEFLEEGRTLLTQKMKQLYGISD